MSKNFEKEKNMLWKKRAGTGEEESGKQTERSKTLFIALITAFITTFMGSALNLAVPAIEEEFQAGVTEVNWIITIYMLTCAALAVPFGKIADRIDRKSVLRLGIMFFAISSLSAIFSKTIGALLFFRLMQGIGASMIFSTNIAILTEVSPTQERGKLLGYVTGANYLGLSAGPVLGGMLNQYFGWRSVFITTAAVSAVAFGLATGKSKGQTKRKGFFSPSPLDIKGSFFYIAGVITGMYGLSVIAKPFLGGSIILLSSGLWFCFFRTERRAEDPVLKMGIFRRNPAYLCSNLAALLNYGANFAISYLLSVYLQVVLGYSSQKAGFILIVSPFAQALFSPWMGKLSDKRSPQGLSAIGMAFCAGALYAYGFLLETGQPVLLIGALCISGMGFAIFSSPNTNAVMTTAKGKDYGVTSSVLATMRSLGHTLSMTTVTAVSGFYMGAESLMEAPQEQLLSMMRILFFIFGSVCIVGIFVARKGKI